MLHTFFSAKIDIRIYDIFNDQSFNDTLTNDIVSFKQLGPGYLRNRLYSFCERFAAFIY